jgi:hypothetical protein
MSLTISVVHLEYRPLVFIATSLSLVDTASYISTLTTYGCVMGCLA